MLRYAIRCNFIRCLIFFFGFLGLASLEFAATLKFREKGGGFPSFFSLCCVCLCKGSVLLSGISVPISGSFAVSRAKG